MDQRLIDIHHDYVHHHFDRRRFLEEAGRIAGGATAAAALLPVLDCNFALAQTVADNDPRVTTQNVTFQGATGEMKAYLARPNDDARHPAVIVVHEIGGVSPHIQDVAKRLAVEGYVALAVDFLSPAGGTPAPGQGGGPQRAQQLKPDETYANGVEAVKYLRMRADVNGRVGIVGFCWGGRVVQHVAVREPTLNAAVAFYGQPPHPSEAAKLQAPLLMNYADVMLDMNNGGEGILYAQELRRLGKNFEIQFYPGAQHGFNNDTNQARYNKAAADLAWSRTIAWFKQYLG